MLYLLRKKTSRLICTFLFFFSFLSLCASAQKPLFQEDHDNKPYYFGITLATNLSRFQTHLHSSFLLQDTVLIAKAQTTYLPQGAKENILIERLEIKAGTDSILNFSKIKPHSRKQFIPHLGRIDSLVSLSKVDEYNRRTAMLSNLEWATGNRTDYSSKKPWGKNFYQTPANLFEVNKEDFFLVVNPVVQFVFFKGTQ